MKLGLQGVTFLYSSGDYGVVAGVLILSLEITTMVSGLNDNYSSKLTKS